ncbi:MAG: calcium-translocating P-type ATPase, SERCA-type [Thermoflexus sp.]|uniref:calcium-translocating P-type ATPase, SERCA-type n=1 Tax=Thermoflexus sp. TaxID=1969742 RepID=UPI0025E6B81A|nr:calcium-translocating P-type ATPase, SERCA-type [Thermoflexus sp.]MCS6962475.1 calcium-translocating P-type ATPase, SERCA-type [Thermoflexus sp.]MDW8184882.1 calcium-translocating P-type ATPase, SERCA-type [Anaerolineae bacterium]
MSTPTTGAVDPETLWHTLPVEACLEQLKSRPDGLHPTEAARRLREYGPNQLEAARRISPWSILLAQFKNVLVLILLVATVLSIFLGHGTEAIVILIIVGLAVSLGFIQEYRAERALEALRRMAAPMATVIRDGQEERIPAEQLVPGDIVVLHAGDRVPADLRLIEAINLQIDESVLTGESVPVEKQTEPIPNPQIPVGDRKNMAYAGTIVTYGRGKGLVVATGMRTEFGAIARMLQSIEQEKTPLQENLDRTGKMLARAALVVVAIIVALGLLRGQPWLEMLIFGLALAVAVVPEALPAVVTISLAMGVQRMVRRNALVRRLAAVETLGSTNVICTDKTGTLTRNEMTVRQIFLCGQRWEVTGTGYEPVGEFRQDGQPATPSPDLQRLLRAAALASDARLLRQADGTWRAQGDPTEIALVVAAAKAGLRQEELEARYPRIHEIPFTSERKRMTTVHRGPEGVFAACKGAPEMVLECCSRQLTEDGDVPLTPTDRERILEQANEMAAQGLRVLAVADRMDSRIEDGEEDMTFLGLVGMIDPPRPEAKSAIQVCREAGIRVIMITGDHPATARAVAKELDLLRSGRVITGSQLDATSDEDFERQVQEIEVYARVSPIHKYRIVTALQKQGHIVAMTGDGINDAPALKKADIGVAMGITGTDVSKEAAAMILLDDNFASIVAAVEEGRTIFNNIKKYLSYLLSSNVGEILLLATASFIGLPPPLSAAQILYVNLATDGLPALALSADPPEPDLMRRPPRNPRIGIFTRPLVALMLAGGIWSAVVNLSLFAWALSSGRSLQESMTMAFVSLVLIQFFKAYNFRSDRHHVWQHPFANRWLNLAVLWELFMLSMIIYVPFLRNMFGVYSLPLIDWVIVLLASATISPVLELVKWLERRGWFGGMPA